MLGKTADFINLNLKSYLASTNGSNHIWKALK